MANFDGWLVENGYMAAGETVFRRHVPEKTPLFICVWIMSLYVMPMFEIPNMAINDVVDATTSTRMVLKSRQLRIAAHTPML
jgi:hypothetical protein